jgi:hypothetical protein
MFNFSKKIVFTPTREPKTTGKRISGKVVWSGDKFRVRLKNKSVYDINNWNDFSSIKYVYALPRNTYFGAWHKRPYLPPNEPDKEILDMTKRYWGKYYAGLTIYGKIVDGIFVQSKPNYNERSISEVTKEQY